jgi:1-acyl-sn-glycerol-3-phosphate acyltransferase
MTRALRAPRRFALAVAVLAAGLTELRWATRRGAPHERLTQLGRRLARRLVGVLGLRVEVLGRPPRGPAVLVANHRSWADIPALLHCIECTFLAKREMAGWPLFGALARALRTVFVARECKQSRRRARAELARILAGGGTVALFPEGTTTRGPGLLPFQPGMFWTAAQGGTRVVPVALHYEYAEDAWVDGDTLLGHFLARFSREQVRVRIEFGPPLCGSDGEVLCRAAHDWIAAALERAQGGPDRAEASDSWEGRSDDAEDFLARGFPVPAGPLPAGG